MSAISDAEFYLSSFGHCHHDPLASKKIIEDLLKELKQREREAKDYADGWAAFYKLRKEMAEQMFGRGRLKDMVEASK